MMAGYRGSVGVDEHSREKLLLLNLARASLDREPLSFSPTPVISGDSKFVRYHVDYARLLSIQSRSHLLNGPVFAILRSFLVAYP
jgi:hypothetical protein